MAKLTFFVKKHVKFYIFNITILLQSISLWLSIDLLQGWRLKGTVRYTYICAKRHQNPTAQKEMSGYWKKCPEEANKVFILGHEEANIFVGGG